MRKIVMMASDRSTTPPHNLPVRSALLLCVAAIVGLSACGTAPPTLGISDPHEDQNRAVHALNIALDKNIIRPIATSTTKIVPPEVQQGIVNFADNLELPGRVANDILQLRPGAAVENAARFVINTTIGIGGVFDPASAAGAMGKPTDFGETLYVWGMPEGNYVELPFFGPSNDRDALGRAVDFFFDPLRDVLPCNTLVSIGLPCINRFSTVATIASDITDRGRYSDTYDSILYDSADSYAQTRLLYLEHRRFNLGQAPAESSFEDPYAQ